MRLNYLKMRLKNLKMRQNNLKRRLQNLKMTDRQTEGGYYSDVVGAIKQHKNSLFTVKGNCFLWLG